MVRAKDERAARNVVGERVRERDEKQFQTPRRRITLRDLKRRMAEGETKDLNLIVKADVQGSVEAVRGMLEKLDHAEVRSTSSTPASERSPSRTSCSPAPPTRFASGST